MDIGTVSYVVGALAFLVLTFVLLAGWRGNLHGGLLVSAVLATTIWSGATALWMYRGLEPGWLVQLLEVLRSGLWLSFLMAVLRQRWGIRFPLFALIVSLLLLGQLVLLLTVPVVSGSSPYEIAGGSHLVGFLLISVSGMALVEQLFRNTRPERRWAVKYLCFGLGGLFAYDFYFYADAVLFAAIDPVLQQTRGAILLLIAPLVAVSAARNPQWSPEVFVSRKLVFHSATLIGGGLYLVAMASAGYYLRYFGGEWGGVAQAFFLFGAILVLISLLFSGQMRARLKVFLSKHFFAYKYDYRDEWLRLIDTLSAHDSDQSLEERSLRAVAEVVESPGGELWLRNEDGDFTPVYQWGLGDPPPAREPADASLPRFMERTQWVVNLDEYRRAPDSYEGLELPHWLEGRNVWLVVPLMHLDSLLGFVLVAPSRARVGFNWEDSDLLKTIGRQVAAHLAQMQASRALVEARQFEAFNRLSAFVMHDLKNVAAQLSLLVSNAARHKDNPEFVEDMVTTVDNASMRMQRLLGQLRGNPEGQYAVVDLSTVLDEVVEEYAGPSPKPEMDTGGGRLMVRAERDRLCAVFGHVLRNAQEATGPGGRVRVRLRQQNDQAIVEVADDGPGMDSAFIRERLFKPFESTKGSGGMGIGAYEAREFIRQSGGDVEVISAPGGGGTFRMHLPLTAADGPGLVGRHG
jgi:putative PEP-CTERM system histidine kinase